MFSFFYFSAKIFNIHIDTLYLFTIKLIFFKDFVSITFLSFYFYNDTHILVAPFNFEYICGDCDED